MTVLLIKILARSRHEYEKTTAQKTVDGLVQSIRGPRLLTLLQVLSFVGVEATVVELQPL
jgi:hypothetical protein